MSPTPPVLRRCGRRETVAAGLRHERSIVDPQLVISLIAIIIVGVIAWRVRGGKG